MVAKPPNPAMFGAIDPKDWREISKLYTQGIWPNDLPHSPSDYGNNEFHGRTHPTIIFAALERYTKPGDLVFDPFGGSGTTLDVCEELGRKCRAIDINPTSHHIAHGDARTYQLYEMADHIIFHPPYMDIIKWEGTKEKDKSLSTDDYSLFKALLAQALINCVNQLKMGRIITVIIGEVYKDSGNGYNEVLPLEYAVHDIMQFRGRLMGRIIRSFGETKGGASQNKNENLWHYRRLVGGFWELGKDTVLFYQRIC